MLDIRIRSAVGVFMRMAVMVVVMMMVVGMYCNVARRDPALRNLLSCQLKFMDMQFLKPAFQRIKVGSCVDKRAQGHISAYPRKTVKIGYSHRVSPLLLYSILWVVDEVGQITRSKSVVYIDHADSSRTRVEHRKQRRQPAEARAVADAGGHSDNRPID